MNVAAFRVGGERRVRLIDGTRQTVAAFDLSASEAERGVLAVVERESAPRTLSPVPLGETDLEGGKSYQFEIPASLDGAVAPPIVTAVKSNGHARGGQRAAAVRRRVRYRRCARGLFRRGRRLRALGRAGRGRALSHGAPGQPFHGPEADSALFEALETTVRATPQRRIERVAADINDEAFVERVVAAFHAIAPRRERSA